MIINYERLQNKYSQQWDDVYESTMPSKLNDLIYLSIEAPVMPQKNSKSSEPETMIEESHDEEALIK